MPAKKTRKPKETFQLQAPAAGAVLLAGDFTGWETKPIQMKRDRSGVWKAAVPLEPGAHQYRFLVDGKWADDPQAEGRASNPFGGQNCVREVTAA
ncbi:glycoside hydrolase [bacterium]|nr:glycoside hydrolase [bacterium]